MEYILFFAVIVFIIIAIMLFGIVDERRSEKAFEVRLKNLYGKANDKKHSVNYISFYSETSVSPDDITINDLDLGEIYERVDYTVSRTGEEALARILLDPVTSKDELNKRDSHITYFADNEDDRMRLLVMMRKTSHNLKVPFDDVVDFIASSEKKSLISSCIADILIVALIIGAIFVNSVLFLPLVLVVVYQMLMYYSLKAALDAYLPVTGVVYALSKINKTYRGFSQGFYEEFKDELSEVEKCCDDVKELNRFASFAFNVSDGMDLAGIMMTYINMIFHFDIFKLYSMFRTIADKSDSIKRLYYLAGFIEVMDSAAYFRASLDTWCKPEFCDDTALTLKDIYHPLIKGAVRNDLVLSKGQNGVLLTGSNASGKSTFLKAVSVNALLAQSINTVCAGEYKAPFVKIYSSMALRDDIIGGRSYFVVEVESVKRIFDAVNDEYPLLVTIDEVLRGTNTAERIGAAYALLKDLSGKNAIIFAATHDRELTDLLKDDLVNMHFDENPTDSDISFSYILKEGPANTRNAIRMMEKAGFDPAIISEAESITEKFLS